MSANNYTGPLYSDGKFQESVEFGQTPPAGRIDTESRLHDSAYAHYKDLGHRMAADQIYDERVKQYGLLGGLVGGAVTYGNQTIRATSNLLKYSEYGPIGLIVGSVVNAYNLNDYMFNKEKYRADVLVYYGTDPGFGDKTTRGSNPPNGGSPPPLNEPYQHRRFADNSSNEVPLTTKQNSLGSSTARNAVSAENNDPNQMFYWNPYEDYGQWKVGRRKKKYRNGKRKQN